LNADFHKQADSTLNELSAWLDKIDRVVAEAAGGRDCVHGHEVSSDLTSAIASEFRRGWPGRAAFTQAPPVLHVRQTFGVTTALAGYRNARVNVAIYGGA
jgi:hypothetical protein